MRLRAAMTALTAFALALGLVAVVATPVQATETALSATASSLWQTNATVRAMAYANGRIYVGGEFSSVRAPGAAPGVGEVPRSFLAAFDATTGALVTTFAPVLNGMVWTITPSTDGSRVYIGGDFTQVNGTDRDRVAMFSTSTDALDPTFKPVVSFRVSKLAAFASSLYLVGSFTMVNGVVRNRAAAVDATSGSLLPFDPNVTSDPNVAVPTPPDVAAVAVAQDGTKVYIGGRFTTVGGVASYAMAAVDSSSGALMPFPARSAVPAPTSACRSGVKTIVVNATTVYAGASGDGGGCFDGTFAANTSDGSLTWRNTCLGATEALVLIKGWLYKGSHAHDCSSVGSFPQSGNHFLLAERPGDGSIGPWYPQTDAAGDTQVGPLAFATDGNQLFVGGDFTQVNGVGQQGITRFGPTPETAPVRPKTPSAISPDRGVVKVTVRATTDLDDENLTYRLYRSGTAAPLATWTLRSTFWISPTVQYVDSGLTPGSQTAYRVEVTDGTAVVTSYWTLYLTVASARAPYPTFIAADAAVNYWRLDETSGTVAADAGLTPNLGSYAGVGLGQPGALPDGVDTAASFNGTSSMVSTTSVAQGPQTFSVEAWVKTTTNRGGKIIGYGNSKTGTSSSYDRQLYMSNDGRIQFGVNSGTLTVIRSAAAYNNGLWHHIVGTFQPGLQALYVDAVPQGTTTASSAQTFSGYWRIGKDNVSGWPFAPTSNAFSGTIDEVAVYGTALTAQAVAGHYVAGGGTVSTPAPPVVANDSGSTAYQTRLTVGSPGVLANDTGTGLVVADSSAPAHGTVVVSSIGGYTYTPAAGYAGPDSFTYTVTDIAGQTATATVSITVSVPAAPTANADTASTSYATTLVVAAPGVLSNDVGTGVSVASSTPANHGTATVAADGAYTYSPDAGFVGMDTFTYTVTDSFGRSATATVSVNVAMPAAPVAMTDTLTTALNTPVVSGAPGVLSNDTGSGLAVTASTSAAHGTVSVATDGSLTYAPDANYAGPDSFLYTVSDVMGQVATGTVTVTVVAPAAPTAGNDIATTPYPAAVSGDLLSNDSGTAIVVTSSTAPAHGVTTVAATGAFTYTPSSGFSGPDSFTYTITDIVGRTATATVAVFVGAAPALIFLQDSFTRTVAGSWGNSPLGGAWGPANAALSVDGSAGVISLAAAQSRYAFATGAGQQSDVVATTSFSLDALPSGTGQYTSLILRRAATSVLTEYRGTVRVQTNGKVSALVYRLVSGSPDVVVGPETVIPGLTAAPGKKLSAEFSAIGSNPTTLSLTVWATGSAQPVTPQITLTDSAAALQGTGLVGVVGTLSGTATVSNTVRYDELLARKLA